MKFPAYAVLAIFLVLLTCSLTVGDDSVEMFYSGGQDHRISCAYDSEKDLTTIRIQRFIGTKLCEDWKIEAKGYAIILISSEFFGDGEDAIILANWNEGGVLSYKIFQFFNGQLLLKWARENIPEGVLIPGGKVIGEKKGCQGRGISWDKVKKKIKEGPLPIRPFHQSELGIIVEFKIDEQGKVRITNPNVKQGIRLKKYSQILVLVQNDDSPIIGKISFLGNISWAEGEIPGSYFFPFPSQGEVCITPIGFENAAEKFPLVVE